MGWVHAKEQNTRRPERTWWLVNDESTVLPTLLRKLMTRSLRDLVLHASWAAGGESQGGRG